MQSLREMKKQLINTLSYFWYKYYKSKKFLFNKKTYQYFFHRYNYTWRNERAVEIPIIWDEVKKHNPTNVLELGNVLSHYFPVSHTVIDKYEKSTGVLNRDISFFKSKVKYDLIVAISTIEHIGWDEPKKDNQKIMKALKNLRTMLRKNGTFICTMPLGYNPYLDDLLRKNKIHFSKKYYLRRVSKDNKWRQASWTQIKKAKYNLPYSNANAIIIGIIRK